ncbi:MAG: peptidoglycan-associated lipoprotein [Desulfobulbus propionicus]|nr:MAG: peptidoglycan-associated lipoprotein [Desulfobulbus propionicus]
MRNVKLLALTLAVGMLLGVSGCGKKKPVKEVTEANEVVEVTEPLETQESDILEGRTSGPMLPIYFAFDASNIVGEQIMRIEKNAEFLREHENVNVRIEGNCDPRGTKEYNLALGERRALKAKQHLANLGVAAERMTTVSWGEEKLLLFGQDELSWAQNRRDDFVIVK